MVAPGGGDFAALQALVQRLIRHMLCGPHSHAGQETEARRDFMVRGGTFISNRFGNPIARNRPVVIASRREQIASMCQP